VEEDSPESTLGGEAPAGESVEARLLDCSKSIAGEGADHVSSSARGDAGERPLALAGNNVSGAAPSRARGDFGVRAPRRGAKGDVGGRPPERRKLTSNI
jgi:hypothetical protein